MSIGSSHIKWAVAIPFSIILSSCGEEEGPAIIEGQPLPICKKDARVYSVNEIYSRAIVDLQRDASRRGCSQSAIATIGREDAGCCDITFGINASGNEVAGLGLVNATGYQIGRLRASFYCAAEMPLRPYRYVVATVTSCGNLVSVGGINEASRSSYTPRFSYGK